MGFIADKQTLDDLNLLGKYRNNSVYSLFNGVQTSGGAKLLDQMFHYPLTDAAAINQRSSIFQYFQAKAFDFPLGKEQFDGMEDYLSAGGDSNLLMAGFNTFRRKFMNYIGLDQEYNQAKKGLLVTIEALNVLYDFFLKLKGAEGPYQQQVKSILAVFSDKRLQWLREERGTQQLTLLKMAKYDYLLRQALREEMKTLSNGIYDIDVCISVAALAKSRGFTYAHALPATANVVRIDDFKHPALEKAIGNSVSIHQDSNVIFLTGANMAGKSTFMKSFGICIYLAHMGFPVAATGMEFSVRDGIYSSINVPDDLNQGYSHFYAEVLRVKKVAEEVAAGKDLIVIFDELFKGTNVKDAYDATLAVSEAFSENRNCSFIISTHIIEVGETLRERCDNLQFVYLPTVMNGNVPTYTYRLKEGITSDRHGMMIIENEHILDIILSGNKVTA